MPLNKKEPASVRTPFDEKRGRSLKVEPITERGNFTKLLGLAMPNITLPTSQSCVKDCEKCPRMACFRHKFGLRKAARKDAADAGSFGHATLRRLIDTKGSTQQAETYVSKLMDAVIASVPAAKTNNKVLHKIIKSANVGYAMGNRAYTGLARHMGTGAITVIAAEVPWVARITPFDGCPPILCSGQADYIVQDAANHLYVMDYKTSTMLPSDWLSLADIKMQRHLYPAGLRTMLGAQQFDVDGMLYVVIQTPGIRTKGLHTDHPETQAQFNARCDSWWDGTGEYSKLASWRAANPAIMVRPCPAGRGEWPPEQARRLLEASSMLTRAPTLFNYPPYELSCAFGNSKCEYIDICSKPLSQWAAQVNTLYTRETDPLRAANMEGPTDDDEADE